MKWIKETKVYMWANYYSEDGNWKAWDEDITVQSKNKKYNPKTHKMEHTEVTKHIWMVQNLKTGEIFKEFKTLKAAKEFAESYT